MVNTVIHHISEYVKEITQVLERVHRTNLTTLIEIIKTFRDAKEAGKKIFFMGNGGSAATAAHIVCDLGKAIIRPGEKRFKAIPLTNNIPTLLAWANDQSFEDIFSEQLKNLLDPGDIVLGLSTSGNSSNIVKALEYAREMGAITLALTGMNGGRVKDVAQTNIIIPSNNIQIIEDSHLILLHMISSSLKDNEV